MTFNAEVISFDLDNTLYDYEYSFNIAINDVFDLIIEKYPQLTKPELESNYNELKAQAIEFGFRAKKTANEYRKERFKLLLENFNVDDQELLGTLVEIYSNAFERNLKLYPEVKTVLTQISEKYRLCLISEGPEDMQRNTLEILDLEKYFTYTFFSSCTGCVKIDGSLFEYALKNIKCAPERVIHIGDSQLRDIIGAKHAGLKVVWLNRTKEQLLADKPQADYQISDLEEILDLF